MATSWLQQPKSSELSSNFLEQLHTNTIFIDTLRKQTHKIEEMMNYIERIKSESELKDKLIAQLRKKQAESKMVMMKIQEQKRENFQEKLKFERAQIEELLQQNKKLQRELQIAKQEKLSTFVNGRQLEKLKSVYYQQNRRLGDESQSLRQEIQRWKEKYYNCREQCRILRAEYEQQCKISTELQTKLSISYEKLQNNKENDDKKVNKLKLEIENKSKRYQQLSQINQGLQKQLNSIVNQYELKMRHYEMQFSLISQQLVKIESAERIWKKKYLQLVETIECVNKFRRAEINICDI